MLAQPKQRRRQERPPREINFSFLVLNPQIGNGFVSKAGHGVCERARAINKQTTRRPRSRLGARAYIGARKGGLRRVPQRQKKCEGQKHQKAQSRSTTKHTHTRKHTHTHTHAQPHPKERQAHARHLIHTGHQVPKAESHHEQQQKTTGEKYGVQIDWRGQETMDEKAPSSFFVSSQSPGRLLLIPCAERTRPLFVIYHTKKNGAACCSAVRARVYYYWCYF